MKRPIHEIAEPLVAWYNAHERTFPWRADPSPYRVWISEIMLQQTRIEAALPYFERFTAALPTIQDLANAPEALLLKLWEGLGYYSRVRNLQKAAKLVVERFNGELPDTYEELLTLPGIGEYTAGAIASISFGKRVPAVDGNVLRVMARLTDDDSDVMQPKNRKRLSALVAELVPATAPGAFNQGIMELGETICLPNAMPLCHLCPLRDFCAVAGTERARELPTRKAPKPRRIEDRTVFLILTDHGVVLHRRPKQGLLSGMWEFPNTDREQPLSLLTEWGIKAKAIQPLPPARHVFSHIEWHMNGYVIHASHVPSQPEFTIASKDELKNYALPTAFRSFQNELSKWFKEDVI